MNLDVSVAPEIAQLIDPRRAPGGIPHVPGATTGPHRPGAANGGDAGDAPAQRPTVGRLAAELRLITASPERWWGLVRFDPDQPARVSIPAGPWYEAWLMIIPPSRRGVRAGGAECRCEMVTVVAGEVTEAAAVTEAPAAPDAPEARPLLPGRVRVHGAGAPHRVVNLGRTYAVTMHARVR
ncbi:MAG TPA: hypothetical protein VGN41_18945 [Streptosporangiaceae bacterium]